MKVKQAWFPVLFIGIILLFLLNCYQFRQNSLYKGQNRELILQNDSLIAVTIELKRQVAPPEKATAQHERMAR
jgi:hypothetical protein